MGMLMQYANRLHIGELFNEMPVQKDELRNLVKFVFKADSEASVPAPPQERLVSEHLQSRPPKRFSQNQRVLKWYSGRASCGI